MAGSPVWSVASSIFHVLSPTTMAAVIFAGHSTSTAVSDGFIAATGMSMRAAGATDCDRLEMENSTAGAAVQRQVTSARALETEARIRGVCMGGCCGGHDTPRVLRGEIACWDEGYTRGE